MIDRKQLSCPHGLIIGTPGSGTGYAKYLEIARILNDNPTDEVIIMDPYDSAKDYITNESSDIKFNISEKDLSVYTLNPFDGVNGVNPLYLDRTYDWGKYTVNPLMDKADYVKSLIELQTNKDLSPEERDAVERAVHNAFRFNNNPILKDVFDQLNGLHTSVAFRLAQIIEIFCSAETLGLSTDGINKIGRVTIFRCSCNVKWADIMMPACLEYVWSKFILSSPKSSSHRVWIFMDQQTSWYYPGIDSPLDRYWKTARPNGVIFTAVEHSYEDIRESYKIIPNNTGYFIFLAQQKIDRNLIAEDFDLPQEEVDKLKSPEPGTGIWFCSI